jgi:hypothetical protein
MQQNVPARSSFDMTEVFFPSLVLHEHGFRLRDSISSCFLLASRSRRLGPSAGRLRRKRIEEKRKLMGQQPMES